MKTSTALLLVAVSLSLIGAPANLPAAASPAPDKVDGTWTWEFTMPDGSVVTPKVVLKCAGQRLTGSTSFRFGSDTPISDGAIEGDTLRFHVVRERDGRKVTTKYTGRIVGGTIEGKMESDWAGEWQTYEWIALKPVVPPNSAWKSVVTLPDGTKQQWRMRFQQKRQKLEGKITTSSMQQLEITEGKVNGDEISFVVDRKRPGATDHFEYRGTVQGDTITGKVTAVIKDEKHTIDWKASRPPVVVDGKWDWTHSGAKREVVLKRDGDKLTGKFVADEKNEFEISSGRITDNEIYFEVERERDGEKTLTKFRGTLADDRIVGKNEFIGTDGTPIIDDWQADKVDAEAGGGGGPPRGRNRAR